RVSELRVVVFQLLGDPGAEQGEGLDQTLDVRILAAVGRDQQPSGDLRVTLGELAPVATQEGELALVVGQQVLHRLRRPAAACGRPSTAACSAGAWRRSSPARAQAADPAG